MSCCTLRCLLVFARRIDRRPIRRILNSYRRGIRRAIAGFCSALVLVHACTTSIRGAVCSNCSFKLQSLPFSHLANMSSKSTKRVVELHSLKRDLLVRLFSGSCDRLACLGLLLC